MFAQPRMAMMAQMPQVRTVTMQDKERAEEKSYFSKKDAKLLKALVEKMESNNELEQLSH